MLIGVGFIWSAVPKIREPWAWYRVLLAYDLLPDSLVRIWAVTLPWIELAIGVALVWGVARRAALATATALVSVFAAALISILARDMSVECGCFSLSGGGLISGWTVARTGIFFLLCAGTFFAHRNLASRRSDLVQELR